MGLPRAGSTLIEQILASHSQVDGTLELPNILTLAQSLRGQDRLSGTGNYPEVLKTFHRKSVWKWGSLYQRHPLHRSGAPHFTDKMPNNFRHIGLIHLILPNAKIIDARRAPLDCCLVRLNSCLLKAKSLATDSKNSALITEIIFASWNIGIMCYRAKFCVCNMKMLLMTWRGQVHRMLDYLNLPFEEQCISFQRIVGLLGLLVQNRSGNR